MNRKYFALLFSCLVLTADLARAASLDADLHQSESCGSGPCAPPPVVTPLPVPSTTRVPCQPRPCTATQLVIPLPNPCNPCLESKPLPPPPPKPLPVVLPTPPPCRPVCPPVNCQPTCPVQTCNPCAKPASLNLWPVALKGLKVWKIGTTALTAPVALAGAKIAASAALLPVKLAVKGAVLGGLIAKPIILGTALVTAGAAKVAATVVGIPVAIVTGVKMAALGLKSLFTSAGTRVASTLSTPLSVAGGIKLVVLGKGAQALAQLLDSVGRSSVERAQTLASYGAATQALGNQKLVWGFDDMSCKNLYVMQPVDADGQASSSASSSSQAEITNLLDEEEDIWTIPNSAVESEPHVHDTVAVPAQAPVSAVVQVNTANE